MIMFSFCQYIWLSIRCIYIFFSLWSYLHKVGFLDKLICPINKFFMLDVIVSAINLIFLEGPGYLDGVLFSGFSDCFVNWAGMQVWWGKIWFTMLGIFACQFYFLDIGGSICAYGFSLVWNIGWVIFRIFGWWIGMVYGVRGNIYVNSWPWGMSVLLFLWDFPIKAIWDLALLCGGKRSKSY